MTEDTSPSCPAPVGKEVAEDSTETSPAAGVAVTTTARSTSPTSGNGAAAAPATSEQPAAQRTPPAAICDSAAVDEFGLDQVLLELGSSGRFQIRIFALLLVPVVLFSMYEMTYLFTTGRLDYRCKIPECDGASANMQPPLSFNVKASELDYRPNWLQQAIPFEANGKPSQCRRYTAVNDSSAETSESTCAWTFDQSRETECDAFVYATPEVTLVNEFNITCPENEWRLSIVGSIGYFSDILMLPLHGFLSDRFGRRTMIASALFFVCTLGIAKSFATSYIMFVVFEFLLCMCTPGSFTTLFIMMIEWVVPEKRVLGGTFICIAYSVGQILLGVVSAGVWSFRTLLRSIYAPAYVVLAYMWLVPESVRWLNSKGHSARVKSTIEQAAKVNGVQLSERAQQFLDRNDDVAAYLDVNNKALHICEQGSADKDASATNAQEATTPAPDSTVATHQTIFTSRRLFVRLLICVFCMFSNSAIYIGLNVHSVSLSGSKHFNYIAVNIIEVPANIISYFIMVRMGRRLPFALSLLSTAVLCLLADHVPAFAYADALRLALFVFSKLCITISYSIVYVYISEMFPTCLRQSFMNSCYAMSCMGSMTAPQIALLNIYMPSLPMFLFAGVATVASGLVMLLPETFNNKLPDTIEEAEEIGREQKVKTVENN